MPRWTISFPIEKYKATLCSRLTDWDTSYGYSAVITLYSSNRAAAYLRFKDGVGNNKDYYSGAMGSETLNIFFEESDFDRVLALLQKEAPLFAHMRPTGQSSSNGALKYGLGSLSTDEEPVGEEES